MSNVFTVTPNGNEYLLQSYSLNFTYLQFFSQLYNGSDDIENWRSGYSPVFSSSSIGAAYDATNHKLNVTGQVNQTSGLLSNTSIYTVLLLIEDHDNSSNSIVFAYLTGNPVYLFQSGTVVKFTFNFSLSVSSSSSLTVNNNILPYVLASTSNYGITRLGTSESYASGNTDVMTGGAIYNGVTSQRITTPTISSDDNIDLSAVSCHLPEKIYLTEPVIDSDGGLELSAGTINIEGYDDINVVAKNDAELTLATTDAKLELTSASATLEAYDEVTIRSASSEPASITISDQWIIFAGKLDICIVECVVTPSETGEQAWIFDGEHLYYNDDGQETELGTVSSVKGYFENNTNYYVLNPIEFSNYSSKTVYLILAPRN